MSFEPPNFYHPEQIERAISELVARIKDRGNPATADEKETLAHLLTWLPADSDTVDRFEQAFEILEQGLEEAGDFF